MRVAWLAAGTICWASFLAVHRPQSYRRRCATMPSWISMDWLLFRHRWERLLSLLWINRPMWSRLFPAWLCSTNTRAVASARHAVKASHGWTRSCIALSPETLNQPKSICCGKFQSKSKDTQFAHSLMVLRGRFKVNSFEFCLGFLCVSSICNVSFPISGLIRHFRPEIEARMKQHEEKFLAAKN